MLRCILIHIEVDKYVRIASKCNIQIKDQNTIPGVDNKTL